MRFWNRAFWLSFAAIGGLLVPWVANGGRLEPGTLVRSSERVNTFDPIMASDVAASRAISLVYEGLYSYGYQERPYQLVPVLAESLPDVSEDGLTYRFVLKEGVRFADDACFGGNRGRVITARDVVYSLMRMADARNASPGWWLLRGRIEGLDAFRELTVAVPTTTYDEVVSGLRVVDERTLEMRLTRAAPQFMWALGMSYTAVVAREAVDGYGSKFALHPVGTGPYRLTKWRRQYSLEFERNANWQRRILEGESALEPVAAFERIRFLVINDPSTQWLAFLQDQLDYTGEISRDNWDVVVTDAGELAPDLKRRGIQLQSSPSLMTSYLGFNMDDAVVGRNAKLRQAMNCAFDGAQWERYYNFRATPATGPVPPGIAGRVESPGRHRFDLENARRLMKEAGYPGGIDPETERRLVLTLDIGRTDQQTRESTELLAGMMDEIGIVLRPEYYNWGAFLRRVSQRQSQIFRIAWVADYPDAENFLQLFYGPNDSPGPNRANYHSSAFDRQYEAAMVTTDEQERLRLYEVLQEIVREDCPWLFLSHSVDYSLSHPWLGNYRLHDFPYGMERFYRREELAE